MAGRYDNTDEGTDESMEESTDESRDESRDEGSVRGGQVAHAGHHGSPQAAAVRDGLSVAGATHQLDRG